MPNSVRVMRGALRAACRAGVVLTIILGTLQKAGAGDELALRRQQVADMSLADQQQLLRNQQRFDELPAADQDRMRQLDADLQNDPERAHLQQVLERYHEWLKTLSPEQRAELASLGYDARIKRIGDLMARQREDQSRRRSRFGGEPLPKEDLQAIYTWFGDLAWQRREKLLAEMPETQRKQVERLDESLRRKAILLAAMQRGRSESVQIEPADYERLFQELSPETRDKLARSPSLPQKRRLVREWLGQAVMVRMGSHAMRRAMASISGDELQHFFETLPPPDRQRLMGLPRSQMQDELRQLYLQRSNRPQGPPEDRPPFGPPGLPDHPRPDWRHRPDGARPSPHWPQGHSRKTQPIQTEEPAE